MIGHSFTDWPRVVPVGAPYTRASPALLALRAHLESRYGFKNLGAYGVRPVRGGTLPSTHSYGAAIDLSYRGVERQVVTDRVIPELVAWSAEWGLGAIHDYVGCRIWRAGRTASEGDACTAWWKAQRPSAEGMGKQWADWLHLEVTQEGWGDGRSAPDRGIR